MHQIKIFNSIKQISKESWDSLTEDNIFMCYNWLKTYEDTADQINENFYIMIYDGRKLIGACVCNFAEKSNLRSIDDLIFGRLRKIKLFDHVSFLPVITCNPNKGYGTHLLVSKELDKEDRILIQNKLIDTIEELSIAKKVNVCFYNVTGYENNLIALLEKRGYLKTLSLPLNYLDINWHSFQDYKKHVSGMHPSMKKSIQRQINKNRKASVIIKNMKNIDDKGERLYELLRMNYNKYGNILTIKPDFFQRLKENFGEDAIIYTALKRDEIIGVNVELKNGKESAVVYVGVDHDSSQDDLTYFNILFYEPIKNAIYSRLKRIYFGNSLYKTKSMRGCTITDTYLYYKSFSNLGYLSVKFCFSLHRFWMRRKFLYIKKLQQKHSME